MSSGQGLRLHTTHPALELELAERQLGEPARQVRLFGLRRQVGLVPEAFRQARARLREEFQLLCIVGVTSLKRMSSAGRLRAWGTKRFCAITTSAGNTRPA
jgi:hypothetical protein